MRLMCAKSIYREAPMLPRIGAGSMHSPHGYDRSTPGNPSLNLPNPSHCHTAHDLPLERISVLRVLLCSLTPRILSSTFLGFEEEAWGSGSLTREGLGVEMKGVRPISCVLEAPSPAPIDRALSMT